MRFEANYAAQYGAKYAAIQSMTEIGIGGMVHTFHLPLGGHLLSLNQGFLLTLAIRDANHRPNNRRAAVRTVNGIAITAAAMKSLSPVGKKLTPMLAIAMQGWLYSLGLAAFGVNRIGVCIGMVLLSVWGILQPLLLTAFLFGSAFAGGKSGWEEVTGRFGLLAEYGTWVFVVAVVVKALLAIGVGILGWKVDLGFEDRYLDRLEAFGRRLAPNAAAWAPRSAIDRASDSREAAPGVVPPLQGAFFDLFQPSFLLSLGITTAILAWTGGGTIGWVHLCRMVGASWLLFWTIRKWGGSLQSRFARAA